MTEFGGSGTPTGTTFESPDFFLPDDDFTFGIEPGPFLMRKHVLPNHNAVITGALLWDHENGRRYFVTSAELAQLQVPEPHLNDLE